MAISYVPYPGPIVTRSTALAAGRKRYFTGDICRYGHLSQRLASDGACFECRRLRRLQRYAADPEKEREKVRAYKAANKEKVLASQRERYASDPKKAYRATRAWLLENPEKKRAWRLANKERIDELAKRWREANPEKLSAIYRKFRQANPEHGRIHNRNRSARKKGAEGFHTEDDIRRIRRDQRDRCAFCRMKLRGFGDVDHIVALSRGGSNWPNNLQLLCSKCNRSKHASDPIDFARRNGRLL